MQSPLDQGKHNAHPQHELKRIERLGYRCDVCKGSDGRRYRCLSGCDFDVCGSCWDKGPILTPAPPVVPEMNMATEGTHAAHPHELKMITRMGYSCDVCRGSDSRRYNCSSGCNFDVCGKCWDKGPVAVKVTAPPPAEITMNPLTEGRHGSHAHELKMMTRMGYSCDVCRGKDDRRYHCDSGCNFDVCGKCWDKGPITPSAKPQPEAPLPMNMATEGTHASHAHELKQTTRMGYSCNVCRGKDDRRYRCDRCDYDVCGKCWDKGPITPSVKPQPPAPLPMNMATEGIHSSHAHGLRSTSRMGYSCNVCRGKDDRRYRCDPCDYDVCGKCWDKGPITPLPTPTPAPVPVLQPSVVPSSPSIVSTAAVTSTSAPTSSTPPVVASSPSTTDNSAIMAATHPSHPHEMKFTGVGGYSCDVCRGKDSRRYQCSSGCNFDLCGQCWDKGPLTPSPTLPSSSSKPFKGRTEHHEHPLKRNESTEYFKCDVCRRNMNGYAYHCMRRCNWDMCEECWLLNPVTELTETEPPLYDLKTAIMFHTMGVPLDEGSIAMLNAQPQGWKLHMHPLADASSHRGKWFCDSCKIDGSLMLHRYSCSERCNFDLCGKCYTGGENELRSAVSPQLIPPGPPELTGLPFRDEFDETKTTFWSEFREPYVGQILFSDKPIERFFDAGSLQKEFVLGSEINCRAIWPRALRNYPLGHKKDDPSVPVYGPKYILADAYGHMSLYALQVFVCVTVDGTPVTRSFSWRKDDAVDDALLLATEVGPKPPGSCTGMRNDDACRKYADNFKPETVDFWAMNQSMTFGLVREKVNQSDNWEKGMSTFMKHVSTLTPGEHIVQAEIRFRLVGNEDSINDWLSYELLPASELWPDTFPTPMSHPIARGQFVLRVPAEGPSASGVQLTPDPFPKRNTKMQPAEADRMEALIADWMRRSPEWGTRRHQTERILKVVVTGDWCKLMKEHQCKDYCKDPCPKYEREPWRYNLDFDAVVYRSPVDGWEKEMPCRVFHLGAFAYNTSPSSADDLLGVGVASSYEFDVELVSDSAFDAASIKRCPASMRRGFTGGK